MVTGRVARRIAGIAVIGLVLLVAITLALPVPLWRTGRQPVHSLALQPGSRFIAAAPRIWIDTDAGCGASERTDPDDCFAILMLASGRGVHVAGISTVFGNVAREVSDATVRELLSRIAEARNAPAVHAGAPGPLAGGATAPQPAHAALREALAREPLAIVALGPLTNVAAALRDRPDLQRRVARVIAVMGRRPGHVFHPAEGAGGAMLFGHGPVFRDLNFVSDPAAAAAVVRMQIPLVLVPYDAARGIEITGADLDRMQARGGAAAWIAERSRGWLEFWRADIGRDGFYPFDLVAAAAVKRPDLVRCADVDVRVGGDHRFTWPFREAPALLAAPRADAGLSVAMAAGPATYCPEVAADLRDWLVAELLGPGSGGPSQPSSR